LSLLITPNFLSVYYHLYWENDNYRPWKASRHVTYSLYFQLSGSAPSCLWFLIQSNIKLIRLSSYAGCQKHGPFEMDVAAGLEYNESAALD
jgi:hypothetical protein